MPNVAQSFVVQLTTFNFELRDGPFSLEGSVKSVEFSLAQQALPQANFMYAKGCIGV